MKKQLKRFVKNYKEDIELLNFDERRELLFYFWSKIKAQISIKELTDCIDTSDIERRLNDPAEHDKLVKKFNEKSVRHNKQIKAKQFLVEVFNQMKARTEKDKPNSVFYDVDELGVILEKDMEKKKLFISHKHIWSILESELYGYNHQQAGDLIRDVVEDTLNWKGYKHVCYTSSE